METNLARELKKYYTRTPNGRVVFRNGRNEMTLNRLAAEMAQQLYNDGERDFDSSRLSKVISGHRLFTAQQLAVFCGIMRLTDEERWEIGTELAKDRLHIDLSISPSILQYASEGVYKVYIQGNPLLAIEQAQWWTDWLWERGKTVSSSKERKTILRQIAQVLHMEGWALSAISKPREVYTKEPVLVDGHKITFADYLRYIAKECDDDTEIYGKADHHEGNAHWIVRDPYASIPLLQRALDTEQDPGDQLAIHRALAANYFILGRGYKKSFEAEWDEARRLIDTGNIPNERVVEALEAFVRGWAMLDAPEEAIRVGEEAKRITIRMEARSERSPVREIQFMLAEFEARLKYDPRDKRSLEAIQKKGQRVVQANNNYPRLARRFEELSQLLNRSPN